jgi:L,D-peptidoglycan transpeptidase YkuD (ErfK/YbiS/YcfS/YnhG family)
MHLPRPAANWRRPSIAMNFDVYADGVFVHAGGRSRCALGRGGVAAPGAKQEGDGATPAGVWPLRRLLYRPDRLAAPRTRLAVAALEPDDGWCDAPGDPAYNQPVTLPWPASAEHLWRDDGVYDLIVVLGYNDDPVVPGAGSAIFLHVARADYSPTEGCVALAPADLLEVLAEAGSGDALCVHAAPSRPA